MNPHAWLNQRAPGFGELSDQEGSAILYFSLLWSFFEATALHTSASSNRILALVHEWAAQNRLNLAPFSESLSYFKNRYFVGGQFSHLFDGLNLRRDDSPELVKAVISGANTNEADCVATLLIIVYRLRNNLFHGVKWAYGIRDQLDNFTNANNAIMAALETHGNL
ncbi:MAG: hypothetical protein ACOY6E_00805 [Pseudomonadota bacterium]|jgi:hypothetical protein